MFFFMTLLHDRNNFLHKIRLEIYAQRSAIIITLDRFCLFHFCSAKEGLQIQREEFLNHKYFQVSKSLRKSHENLQGKFGKCSQKVRGKY